MACIQTHWMDNDWCHICGRREDATVDVWYPKNAEHDLMDGIDRSRPPLENYVRICKGCAMEMALTAKDPES